MKEQLDGTEKLPEAQPEAPVGGLPPSEHLSSLDSQSQRSRTTHSSARSKRRAAEKEREYEAAKQRLELERNRMAQSKELDERLLAAQRARDELALHEKHLELQRKRKQEEEEMELARARLAAEYEERQILKEKEQFARQMEMERQFHTAELNFKLAKVESELVQTSSTCSNVPLYVYSQSNALSNVATHPVDVLSPTGIPASLHPANPVSAASPVQLCLESSRGHRATSHERRTTSREHRATHNETPAACSGSRMPPRESCTCG